MLGQVSAARCTDTMVRRVAAQEARVRFRQKLYGYPTPQQEGDPWATSICEKPTTDGW
jgi:hypothetical protein